MKASIVITTSEKQTANGYPIYVRLADGPNRLKACIGHSLIEYWDKNNKTILPQHPDYYAFLPVILDNKARIVKVNYGNYTFKEASGILFEPTKQTVSIGLLAFFDIRINEKKILGEPYKSYENVKNIIKNFILGTDISINDITYEWLNEFTLFKLNNGCGHGGVNSYKRTISAVYKEAQRRSSLNIKKDNPFIGVFKTTVTKPVVEVSKKTLKHLQNFVPKPSTTKKNALKMQRNIAIWFFQFYIGGHDYIDIALLTWDAVKNNRVKFRRYKNRNKKAGGPMIDNLLSAAALKVIESYGDKTAKRVFSFIPNPKTAYNDYINFRRTVNKSLELISKTLKLDQEIRTKTPRYVFRTYATEILIHDLIVMKLQGHTPDGISYNYQGNISYKVLDEAHLKIIDI